MVDGDHLSEAWLVLWWKNEFNHRWTYARTHIAGLFPNLVLNLDGLIHHLSFSWRKRIQVTI
jgi:hypothetical protein